MKRLFFTLFALLTVLLSEAQNSQCLNYQAVVRDNDGLLLKEQTVGVEIQLVQGSLDGTPVYTETHTAETNANGVLTLKVGAGISSDTYEDIEWSKGPFFIKTSLDISGGNTYSVTGTSELLSVPFAIYATTAESVNIENDPLFHTSLAAQITVEDTTRWGSFRDTVFFTYYDTLITVNEKIDSIRHIFYDTLSVNIQIDTVYQKIVRADSIFSQYTYTYYDTIYSFNIDTVVVQNYDTIVNNIVRVDSIFEQHSYHNYDTIYSFNFDTILVQNYDTIVVQNYDTIVERIHRFDSIFEQRYNYNYDTIVVQNYDTVYNFVTRIDSIVSKIYNVDTIYSKVEVSDTSDYYITTEKVTHKKWIDESPIYRIVYNWTEVDGSATINMPYNEINQVTSIEGGYTDVDGNTESWQPIGSAYGSLPCKFNVSKNTSLQTYTITVTETLSTTVKDAYLILEYTKTE